MAATDLSAHSEKDDLPEVPESRRAVFAANVRRWSGRAFDFILPPLCPVTGERVAAPGLLSANGWAQMRFIDDPVCARCGVPFAHDHGEGAECAACIAEPPVFGRGRAALIHDGPGRELVIKFKHTDRTELAPLLGTLLARAGASMLSSASVLAPVPLHRRRLFSRRYNQAGILAGEVARIAGIAVIHDALERRRWTEPQQSLSRGARARNVAGAFAVRAERQAEIAGAHVVLVDDVLTTGATLSACARALKKAGAAAVDALVLARVVRGGDAL